MHSQEKVVFNHQNDGSIGRDKAHTETPPLLINQATDFVFVPGATNELILQAIASSRAKALIPLVKYFDPKWHEAA
jgi:hypothetical protein